MGTSGVKGRELSNDRAATHLAARDEDDLVTIYEHVVKSLGFKEEFVAPNGVDMVVAIASCGAHPDRVIMDCRMPRMDGRDAAARISDMDSSVRVVLVTAEDSAPKCEGHAHRDRPETISLLRLDDALKAAAEV
jgi:CheY-like chemotaxis protein